MFSTHLVIIKDELPELIMLKWPFVAFKSFKTTVEESTPLPTLNLRYFAFLANQV